jgi:hypothetical protein
MLCVIMLNVVMLNIVMLSVIDYNDGGFDRPECRETVHSYAVCNYVDCHSVEVLLSWMTLYCS